MLMTATDGNSSYQGVMRESTYSVVLMYSLRGGEARDPL